MHDADNGRSIESGGTAPPGVTCLLRKNPLGENSGVCVLLISWRQRTDLPLVVAANRDEAYARPSTVPERIRAAGGTGLAPRDGVAGGTWIGIAPKGLVVAITNRRDGDFDARRPSRGDLCRRALEQPDAASVHEFLKGATADRRTNSFNLFFADRRRAVVTSWNGALATLELQPGIYVLSNEHGFGEVEAPRFAALVDERIELVALRDALRSFLVQHEPEPRSGLVICKHGKLHGTVSSTLVFLPRDGPAWIEHAPGPPCRTAFTRYALPGTVPVP